MPRQLPSLRLRPCHLLRPVLSRHLILARVCWCIRSGPGRHLVLPGYGHRRTRTIIRKGVDLPSGQLPCYTLPGELHHLLLFRRRWCRRRNRFPPDTATDRRHAFGVSTARLLIRIIHRGLRRRWCVFVCVRNCVVSSPPPQAKPETNSENGNGHRDADAEPDSESDLVS